VRKWKKGEGALSHVCRANCRETEDIMKRWKRFPFGLRATLALCVLLGAALVPSAGAAPILEPAPDIKANGSDGPVSVSVLDTVSVTVSLMPGLQAGQMADWFVIAELQLGPVSQYFSIVYPGSILSGIHSFIQISVFPLPSTELYDSYLPPGDWVLHFGIDNNADGRVDGTWRDAVTVHVGLLP
jgi:hypothetical protein